jgi:Tol biopolymer transport system component
VQPAIAHETRREILAGIFLNSDMKKLFSLALACVSFTLFAQTGSEIIVFDLKIKKNKVTISNPKNITNHPGYDNQPFFHPDQPFVYFSSFNDDGRSDIKRYSLTDNTVVNITNTPEREYSPTLTPDKQFLSCIIQRDNGAQDLGKYPVDGGEAALILDSLIVGYHVWLDNSHLGLFILGGEGKPNDLHLMRLPTKEDTAIATNIGRSLHKIPGERAISFIQNGETDNSVMKYNTEEQKASEITKTINKGQDIAWTQDGKIITSDGTTLFWIDGKKPKAWAAIEILKGSELLKSVTRIAVNATGDKIAIVVAE